MNRGAHCKLYIITYALHTAFEASISIILGPVDIHIKVGEVVLCDCRYTGTNDLPLWKINGVLYLPNMIPPRYMANSTGIYFQACQELHLSTFQCLFTFYDDASQSIETINSSVGTVFVSQG